MPAWLDFITFVLVQLFMFIGLIGLLVPIFPGLAVIWLAAVGYGVVQYFSNDGRVGAAGIIIFIFITLLMLVGSIVDNIMMGAGARKGGAAWLSIGVALLAGVLGTILFPPFGGIIAAPLAVLALEYIRLRDLRKAGQALTGLAAGWGLSIAMRFAIGVVMILLWWLWVWVG
jgi:uncharacterized protein